MSVSVGTAKHRQESRIGTRHAIGFPGISRTKDQFEYGVIGFRVQQHAVTRCRPLRPRHVR